MNAEDKCTLCGITRAEAFDRSMGLFCPTADLAMHVWPGESCSRCQSLAAQLARAEKTRNLAQEASSRDALEKQALREELFQVKVELMGLRQQG